MAKYAMYNNPKAELKTKDRADLLEAFIGALYVDQVTIFFLCTSVICFIFLIISLYKSNHCENEYNKIRVILLLMV